MDCLFCQQGGCDATVAVVDGQGKIVRHLASGVLGKNAPAPFQKASLAQKIEWDGKDDFGKPAPAECRVKVSLGLTDEASTWPTANSSVLSGRRLAMRPRRRRRCSSQSAKGTMRIVVVEI